ncbi:hypothetical protein [Halarcobacter bivalviorum]|uniref:Uncharacterized protein n=1 Tax=Halarcobacter bivalviorum TaxID=663364 RepID=A0AAX2ADE2_9BACT|nr:hypothetical protein [Halarcobacter bivalviorum]AXH12216.1 hypothetical protein ABIV_1216 [Halarcobacter bivalviorum]RXK11323.1 hypothetical protein CRV05_02845 [Halarcobacter bivalviorum]
MNSSINIIFLRENEKNIFQTLKEQGIDSSKFEHHFIDLFNKMYNNEVGYYIFEQDEKIYKIIVLPKTIEEKNPTAQKEFVDYLLHYYRVNNKYKFDKTKQIPNSLLSLAFESNNQKENNAHNPIEVFEYYKYKSIIDKIEIFFKRHKNYKRVQVDYKSQDIKYKLNLSKNIKELDNTKIHQVQNRDLMYSEIATICYGALKLFSKKRIEAIKDSKYQKELHQNTQKVVSFIAKKYSFDKGYKFTLSKLGNFKTSKIFSKKSDMKLLLVDIKSLFGFEQMYDDSEIAVTNRYDLKTTSFFINPTSFYEWYVYDILKDFAYKNSYKILFDKHSNKENKTTVEYDLISNEYGKDKERSANPDYVLLNESKNIKIVLDAKWKSINSLGKIDSNDFLKLQRDALLLKKLESKIIPYLIYPYYLNNQDHISILKDDDSLFNFGILQIDMNFTEENNSIDFKYDFEEIEKQIELDSREAIIKESTQEFIEDIEDKRSEVITKLLNSENFEDKEEIFAQLDDALIKSSDKLLESLEEKISPEVQNILDIYENVLEEDSIKFLKSSSSIYNYYKDKNFEHFDYSMPASGLWKLVELELNTSFSWFLRIKSNVCDNTCPWTNISNSRRSITQDLENGKRVKLNQYEYNDNTKLQGLMLGSISLLLQDNNTIVEFDEITNIDRTFFVLELITFMKKVINLRNEHAHIKSMSLVKYEELYNLLFNDKKVNRLLDMKKTIIKEIKQL